MADLLLLAFQTVIKLVFQNTLKIESSAELTDSKNLPKARNIQREQTEQKLGNN